MSERLDKALVALGLATTRSQAQQLIEEGHVYYRGQKITKAATKVELSDLEVRKDIIYVGRGAHKIEGALLEFQVEVADKIIADVGASTGGFTDYVLKKGAIKVYAIDVGHDQLAKSLREDSRVINLEGVNIRNSLELPEKVDLAVVDLSFISLKLTLDSIISLVKDDGDIIVLVKPQFEAGLERLGKNAIVKDQKIREEILGELFAWCLEKKYFIRNAMRSPIIGGSGNVEYFFHIDKKLSAHAINSSKFIDL